jgi:hypothetical protein
MLDVAHDQLAQRRLRIEPPSATLAALRILAMAHAIAAVRALPARPMMTR